MKAIIALQDGTVYEGKAFGAAGTTWGEVVFNTGMTGYQEMLTDPSYAGQILTLTYPLIGNYGTAGEFAQSLSVKVRGLIVREISTAPVAPDRMALDEYLKSNKVLAVEGVDTRSLVKKIRRYGVMKGALSTEYSGKELLSLLKTRPDIESMDLVKEVTAKKEYSLSGGIGPRIALLDLGVKSDIIKSLINRGCRVTVFPADTPADKILSRGFEGVLLSNGPGDPKKAVYAVRTVEKLLGKIPIFGICLGHQVLALALGADTYKLKFGHRGGNHPVKDIKKDRAFMTSQNHGYAVNENSLDKRVNVVFVHAGDGTVEGIEAPALNAFSVQFHPEASPGPTDAAYLFDEFLKAIKYHSSGATMAYSEAVW
jgi:carbamoyl-phosphate synthase small subunit